jgi:hypothetical protein
MSSDFDVVTGPPAAPRRDAEERQAPAAPPAPPQPAPPPRHPD